MRLVMRLLALFISAAAVLAAPASAQQKKAEPKLRTVRGQVLDKDENPIPSGLVFLKNTQTQSVRTYSADEAGNYHFSGLDPNSDYEIHAEHEGMKSQTHTISSLDGRKELVFDLKVDRKETSH